MRLRRYSTLSFQQRDRLGKFRLGCTFGENQLCPIGSILFPVFDDLTVGDGETLTIGGVLDVVNTLTVESGGTIILGSDKHDINGGSTDNPYGSGSVIMATDIVIAAGGSINADGQGFCYGHGPGAGIRGSGDYGICAGR